MLTWLNSPTQVFDVSSECILEALLSLLYTFNCVRETILTCNVCPESLFCVADHLLPLCRVRAECARGIVNGQRWGWQGWRVSSWTAAIAGRVWSLGGPVPCIVGLEHRVVVAEFLD